MSIPLYHWYRPLKGSLDIIRGESVVFTHFQDVTTKISMVGSNSVMWAKRTVEGTHIGTKEPGATFNLETKRLDMGWTEIAFNEINFVEWDKDTCISQVASSRLTESDSSSPLRK